MEQIKFLSIENLRQLGSWIRNYVSTTVTELRTSIAGDYMKKSDGLQRSDIVSSDDKVTLPTSDGSVEVVKSQAGKGLSSNDYTAAEKEKLSGVAAGAEVNQISQIKVNGSALTPDEEKAVDIAVPSPSDMERVVDARLESGHYVTESAAAEMIASEIGRISPFHAEIVASLPEEGEEGTLYLVPREDQTEGNLYDEYMWIASAHKFELLGIASLSLDGYLRSDDLAELTSAEIEEALNGE